MHHTQIPDHQAPPGIPRNDPRTIWPRRHRRRTRPQIQKPRHLLPIMTRQTIHLQHRLHMPPEIHPPTQRRRHLPITQHRRPHRRGLRIIRHHLPTSRHTHHHHQHHTQSRSQSLLHPPPYHLSPIPATHEFHPPFPYFPPPFPCPTRAPTSQRAIPDLVSGKSTFLVVFRNSTPNPALGTLLANPPATPSLP